jgi:hypothetical protein
MRHFLIREPGSLITQLLAPDAILFLQVLDNLRLTLVRGVSGNYTGAVHFARSIRKERLARHPCCQRLSGRAGDAAAVRKFSAHGSKVAPSKPRLPVSVDPLAPASLCGRGIVAQMPGARFASPPGWVVRLICCEHAS